MARTRGRRTRHQTLMNGHPDAARLKSGRGLRGANFLAAADDRTALGSERPHPAWDEKWVQVQELVHRLAFGGLRGRGLRRSLW